MLKYSTLLAFIEFYFATSLLALLAGDYDYKITSILKSVLTGSYEIGLNRFS